MHLLKAWQTYITSVKGLLQDKKWYSKVTEGENEWKAWIQRIKDKVQWIKGTAKEITKELSNSTMNAYEAYDSRPVGGNRKGGLVI